MSILTEGLKAIFAVLFVEALLFAPVVILWAILGEVAPLLKYYGVPFLFAVMPYIIWKKAKPMISCDRRSFALMLLGVIVGFCFLLWFTLLVLAGYSGHGSIPFHIFGVG